MPRVYYSLASRTTDTSKSMPPLATSYAFCVAAPEAIADGSNPFAISQIPNRISFVMMGSARAMPIAPTSTPNVSSTFSARINTAPAKPQMEMNLGRSLKRYNVR